MRLRSLLFTPGSRPDRFEKARTAGADAIVLDLEDAVSPHDKASARSAIAGWISRERTAIVRINGIHTPWFQDDLAVASLPGVSAVMLPKAEHAEHVDSLTAAGIANVVPLIETAAGIAAARKIARARGVLCLAFGSVDLQADLDMRDALEEDLLSFRSEVLIASRLAGLNAPIDGVTLAVDDQEQLRRDVARARRLGFGGKLCIHPRQLDTVHRGFAPSPTEIAWAHRVQSALTVDGGVVTVDGKMVDKPVAHRAEAILKEAAMYAAHGESVRG